MTALSKPTSHPVVELDGHNLAGLSKVTLSADSTVASVEKKVFTVIACAVKRTLLSWCVQL